MDNPQKIFLIGFMGSGKTTLGKKLANKLNFLFIDLDAEIEKEETKSVNEIFKNHGEEYFRKLENKIIHKVVADNKNSVISVGGGTPCFYDNMKFINQSGISVYLKYNSGILASRLLNNKIERPLIKNLDEASLKEFVSKKLNERESDYNKSKIIVEGDNLKVNNLIDLIKKVM